MPGLTILDSYKGIFTSYNFGNVVAGASTANLLMFVSSTGPGTASGAAFGIKAIAGNDGNTFAELSAVKEFSYGAASISGSAAAGAGSISGSKSGSLYYCISTIDAFGYESQLQGSTPFAPSMTGGVNTYTVSVTWQAVSGAATYGVYLSTDSGTTYKQITITANLTYSDTSGTATSVDPQPTGTYSHRPTGSWVSGSSELSLGNMAAGTVYGVFLKEVVASGTTSANNPRQHYVYARYTA